jgi:hypothetical protein
MVPAGAVSGAMTNNRKDDAMTPVKTLATGAAR